MSRTTHCLQLNRIFKQNFLTFAQLGEEGPLFCCVPLAIHPYSSGHQPPFFCWFHTFPGLYYYFLLFPLLSSLLTNFPFFPLSSSSVASLYPFLSLFPPFQGSPPSPRLLGPPREGKKGGGEQEKERRGSLLLLLLLLLPLFIRFRMREEIPLLLLLLPYFPSSSSLDIQYAYPPLPNRRTTTVPKCHDDDDESAY